MSTTKRDTKRRRRYINKFKLELVGPEHEQALETYSQRMFTLRLFSPKSAKSDVKSWIMQIAAKLCGYRWHGDWLRANNLKAWWKR